MIVNFRGTSHRVHFDWKGCLGWLSACLVILLVAGWLW